MFLKDYFHCRLLRCEITNALSCLQTESALWTGTLTLCAFDLCPCGVGSVFVFMMQHCALFL